MPSVDRWAPLAYSAPEGLRLLTVVETRAFSADVDRLMTKEEVRALTFHLAAHPDAGDLLAGSGGARKVRWAGLGRGKSGGFRVITFFHDWTMPVFLLAIFGKNERSNLSRAETNALKTMLAQIVEQYAARKRRGGQDVKSRSEGPRRRP